MDALLEEKLDFMCDNVFTVDTTIAIRSMFDAHVSNSGTVVVTEKGGYVMLSFISWEKLSEVYPVEHSQMIKRNFVPVRVQLTRALTAYCLERFVYIIADVYDATGKIVVARKYRICGN